MFLTFEDYLVLWTIFLFAFKKMPAVLYFIWGKGEAQDACNELVELRGVGPGEFEGCG